MKLNAPSTPVFLFSLVLVILALVGSFIVIPFVSANAAFVAIVAYIILAANSMMSGT